MKLIPGDKAIKLNLLWKTLFVELFQGEAKILENNFFLEKMNEK